jgi:hypothetical protein
MSEIQGTPIVPVPSGNLSKGSAFDDSTEPLSINRYGVRNVSFDGKTADHIDWQHIRKIEVDVDEARFFLYNGMVGTSGHSIDLDKDSQESSTLSWYKTLEGFLILWSLQSAPWFKMKDGRTVYSFGVPRIIWLTGSKYIKKTKNAAGARAALYNQIGLDTQKSGEIFAYHDEAWTALANYQNEQQKQEAVPV